MSEVDRVQIDRIGERFIVTGNTNDFGSHDLSSHQGKGGVILSNDGWGKCYAKLDDGSTVRLWNGADVTFEANDAA